MAPCGRAVIAQPIQKELAKDNDQGELAKAPGNTPAHALILQQVLIPRQLEILIEVEAKHRLQLHQVDPGEEVEGHRQEKHAKPEGRGMALRQGIWANDLPEVEVAGNEEHVVHDEVAGVLRNGEFVQAREKVEHVEEKEVLRQVHEGVGNDPHELRLGQRQGIIVRAGLALRTRFVGLHDQGNGRA